MASDHASRKLLCNAICGDEAESAKGCAFASQQLGGVIPPKHHEVGTTGNIGMNFPYSFGIFIAELLAEILPCSKGRIADDVIRLRPFWPFRVLVAIDLDLVSFRVCSCDGLASVIERQFLRVAGEHGVRDLNRLEIAENRLGRHPAARAKLPLQKADPEHQFGDRRRAGIDFKSQELVRVDGLEFVTGEAALSGERGQGLQNFAFEPFHQFERYIKEVSGAAGRIENANAAKLFVKSLHQGSRSLRIALAAFGLRCCLDIRPFGS
jgi:hypothetical protein